MGKKAIAAILLVVITAWAEITLAPMLAMHWGHMRPGHEMAADMPAIHAGHHHAPDLAQSQGRRCCPGLRKLESMDLLEAVSDSPACDDPHSCCFRQGPQGVPAPARDIQRLAREIAPGVIAEAGPMRVAARRAVRNAVLAVSPPPGLFGMALRV